MLSIKELQDRLASFASERDWDQFHSPKNLVMALSGEVGELVSIFQWMSEEESLCACKAGSKKKMIEEEVADVMIYLARFCDKASIDLDLAVSEKISLNEKKYPVEFARGSSKKYTENF